MNVVSMAAMRPPLLPLTPLIAAALVSACGQAPAPAASAVVVPPEPAQRLSALTDLDQRVARVSARLLSVNADLCPTLRQSAGWTLHSASQYGSEIRPFAEERFGLSGDLPGVLAAPEGSPAAGAGVRIGDLLLAVDGERLEAGVAGGAAQYEGLAANLRRIDRALSAGPAEILVRRGGAERTVTVEPRQACGYDVQVDPSGELNARADGARLFISTALASFAANDDELALILGHELAHHVLGHRRFTERGGDGRFSNPGWTPADGGAGNRERQADRVGLILAARAGYDPSVAPGFWRRFGESNWRVRYPQIGHASAGSRAAALEEVVAEIEARRAAGRDLTP